MINKQTVEKRRNRQTGKQTNNRTDYANVGTDCNRQSNQKQLVNIVLLTLLTNRLKFYSSTQLMDRSNWQIRQTDNPDMHQN